jgi:hypothetical protein
MLAAAGLGIGSCHSAVGDQNLARELLGYPADKTCDLLISLGYPAGRPLTPISVPDAARSARSSTAPAGSARRSGNVPEAASGSSARRRATGSAAQECARPAPAPQDEGDFGRYLARSLGDVGPVVAQRDDPGAGEVVVAMDVLPAGFG